MTKTNPAGLSAMVEAMACGALVGIPEYLAEGYVTDGVNGLLLSERPQEFAERVLNYSGGVSFMRSTAREFADRALNVRLVAANLQTFLVQHLKIYHQTV
jgi:hypothetical protein